MKQYLYILLTLTSLLFACNNEITSSTPQTTADTYEETAITPPPIDSMTFVASCHFSCDIEAIDADVDMAMIYPESDSFNFFTFEWTQKEMTEFIQNYKDRCEFLACSNDISKEEEKQLEQFLENKTYTIEIDHYYYQEHEYENAVIYGEVGYLVMGNGFIPK